MFEQINNFHLKTHGITHKEYCERFPNAPLISEEMRRSISETLTGRTKETHEYLRIISEKITGRTKENDKGMKAMSEKLTGRTKENHEGVRRQSEKMKERPKESYKHLNRTGLTKENDESVRKGAEKLKERWENPTLAMIEERRKTGEKLKGRNPKNNEGRRRAAEKMTGKIPTKKMIEGHKKAAKTMTEKNPTSAMVEGRKKQSAKMKGRTKENDEGMKKMSEKLTGRTGEQCPNWMGGISYLPYCEKFDNDLKNRVREFFNCCCYVCGKNEIDNGRKLDVHHVAYNKDTCCDNSKPLFVPLCRSCHSKTRGNREYWEEFFTVSLEYLTDGKCFYSKEDNTYKKRT